MVERLIAEWSIDWFIGWLKDQLTDWLIDWLTDWSIGRQKSNDIKVIYKAIMHKFKKL